MKNLLQKKLKKQGGFTLVEMLIVVAIIAILIAVSIPMISGALDKARQATDAANIRAAKGAASITYLTGKEEWEVINDKTTVKAYDAEKGTIEDSGETLNPYRKYKVDDATNGEILYVSVYDGVVYYRWAAPSATSPDGMAVTNGTLTQGSDWLTANGEVDD